MIRSFNEDKPYARFIKEQIAGDVLYPNDPEGILATGFIAAGPWDFVGHVELREGTIDKEKTRLNDRDDMVANTMNTFASTTVQCAQCHDHKFDPITQEDYYSLQAVFAALDRADRRYYADAEIGRRATELESRLCHACVLSSRFAQHSSGKLARQGVSSQGGVPGPAAAIAGDHRRRART